MALFAISDLHLPAREKPMDVFGAHWENHFERIREDWLQRVGAEDVVLLPGDLTWAMRLEDAMEDIARVANCRAARSSCAAITITGGAPLAACAAPCPRACTPCKTTPWNWTACFTPAPGAGRCPPTRRTRTISASTRASGCGWKCRSNTRAPSRRDAPLAVMTTTRPSPRPAGVSDLLEAYGARICVYGHLHGAALSGAFRGERNGIAYYQASCDGLGFKLLRIPLDAE